VRWQRFFPLALGLLLFGREPVLAQPAPSEAQQYKARVNEAVRALTSHPSLNNIPEQKRQQLAAFVVGNVSFVLLHEMAHALVHELNLPVLGREEDARYFRNCHHAQVGDDIFTPPDVGRGSKGLVLDG
jgi:Putative metallopeptidase